MRPREQTGRWAQVLPAMFLGAYSLCGQTLAFRAVSGLGDGDQLALAAFFSSWLGWFGLGLLLGRSQLSSHPSVPSLLLIQPPALALQLGLLTALPSLMGAGPHEPLPAGQLCLALLLSNAPFPLLGGWTFQRLVDTAARLWGGLSGPRVYLLDALGGLAGGLVFAIWLFHGLPPWQLALSMNLLLGTAILLTSREQPRRMLAAGLVLAASLGAAGLLGDGAALRAAILQPIYPEATVQVSASTPSGELARLQHHDQELLVLNGRLQETLPDPERSVLLTTLVLARNPLASSILLVGPGIGLVEPFAALGFQRILLHHPDPAYLSFNRATSRVPGLQTREVSLEDDPEEDPETGALDAILMLEGTPTNLVTARLTTVEGLTRLAAFLAPGGILLLTAPGAPNHPGAPALDMVRSLRRNLATVFASVQVILGNPSLLLASREPIAELDAENAVAALARRQDRGLLSPVELRALLAPDRKTRARELLTQGGLLPEEVLLGTYDRPSAQLLALVLLAEQGGSVLAVFLRRLVLLEPRFLLLCLLVLFALHGLYLSRCELGQRLGHLGLAGTAASGISGITFSLILALDYQFARGSLCRDLALLSASFMLGLALGTASASALRQSIAKLLLGLSLFLQLTGSILLAMLPAPGDLGTTLASIVGAGFVCGLGFPSALALLGTSTEKAGALLVAENMGAALAAALIGSIALPALGRQATLLLLAATLCWPLLLLVHSLRTPSPCRSPGNPQFALLGYLSTAGFLVLVLLSSSTEQRLHRLEPRLTLTEVQALARQGERLEAHPGGFELYAPDGRLAATVLASTEHPPQPQGYGGELTVVARINPRGVVEDFLVRRHLETPSFWARVLPWAATLRGNDAVGLGKIDALSGATVSATALTETLRRLAMLATRHELASPGPMTVGSTPTLSRLVYLLLGLTFAVILTLVPRRRPRRVILLLHLAFGGIFLDMQYGLPQVAALLSGAIPWSRLDFVPALLVLVPLLSALGGNLYCGHLCPFGALQELLGDLSPLPKPSLSARLVRLASLAKYGLFFTALSLYFLTREGTVLEFCPLAGMARLDLAPAAWTLAILALVGTLFYPRVWCRFLCPTGAFLALLGRLTLFTTRYPRRRLQHCPYHIVDPRQLDCLRCHRCCAEYEPEGRTR